MNNSRGFVYVATGLQFVKEAAEATKFLRVFHQEPICLITDKIYPDIEPFWTDIIFIEKPHFNLKDKTNLYLAPYHHCLFLDTDTYVTEPVYDIFELLNVFDLAAHQLYEGHEYDLEDIPHSFPEFNTGVIAYRKDERFKSFCKEWQKWFDYFSKDTPNDQRSFRKTLYFSNLRHTVLSPEYNYRAMTTNFAIQKLKIIHGRTFPLLQKLEMKMNKKAIHRAYVPALDVVVSDYMEISELYQTLKRSILLLLKELFKKMSPVGIRNRIRNNKWVRKVFLKNDFQEWMR
jgi:hypothetical protein